MLLDRYLSDDSQREDKPLVRDRRPLVLADGEALPFRDKAFDYCICMHVIEHTRNPGLLLTEMQRVATAGYIEAPSELFDWMFAVPPYTQIHRWFVNLVAGELVLTPKPADTSARTHRAALLLDHLRRQDAFLERWLEKSPHLFTVQHEWQHEIRWQIVESSPLETLHSDSEADRLLEQCRPASPYYWGCGWWGFKRWLYASTIHPRWRKCGKNCVRVLLHRRSE